MWPCDLLRGSVPLPLRFQRRQGFSLIELLLVIAIIGILSTLIITSVVNASRDAWRVVARQQQITVQDALNSWVSANSSGTNTLLSARTTYNAASTSLAKLGLLTNYLHSETYSHLTNFSSSSQIKSDAMSRIGVHLEFSSWNTTNYPVVGWHTN
ncbi:MAG: type II secretion system protein [Chthoniobacterales bacterium]|nr:type II secretion system protein [Chthoniobacterales bacterium]